ncbi:putative ribonuclease H-like domain-containing protein [Tanacetum coccineum]
MQGYTQEEGIDYDEVFAPVARIEAIRLFFAYASFMGFIVYQMDVKSAFLYGTIEDEVYVCQAPSFEDPLFPDKVYKVDIRYLKGQPKLGLWYPRDSPFNLEAFLDSDYVGAIANSTTKAEYVAAANCCGQTATVRTVDNGEQEITATVDGKEFTITKASVRRHL